ncbi:DNA transposition protein [Acidovorax citrulli]|nr:DNA transposition protein [Paracidovorax citrulli]
MAEAQKLVERRGARQPGLVLVKGPYGIGKSELTGRWATDGGWIFVRAKKATWTKRAMLDELADLMGVPKTGRNQEVQARIIGKLAVNMVPMIMTEAGFIVGSTASLLEVVRDITDITAHHVLSWWAWSNSRSRSRATATSPAAWGRWSSCSRFRSRTSRPRSQPRARSPSTTPCCRSSSSRAPAACAWCAGAIANLEAWADANRWERITLEHVARRALCTEFSGKSLGRRAPRWEVTPHYPPLALPRRTPSRWASTGTPAARIHRRRAGGMDAEPRHQERATKPANCCRRPA